MIKIWLSVVASVMSLVAGLVFGGLSAYGAFNLTNDPKDIKISLCEYESLVSFSEIIWLSLCSVHVMVFYCFQLPQDSSLS